MYSRNGTDYGRYNDDGCMESPTCKTCPLLICKDENGEWYRRLNVVRRQLSLYSRTKNISIEDAAIQEGVTERTIWQVRANFSAGKLDLTKMLVSVG